MKPEVEIYDTTLRDGSQGEGINFSVMDKLRITEKLDAFGIHYIEGGWPGSNPKDVRFFAEARRKKFKHARLAAFGSTRRKGVPVESDDQVRLLLEAHTPVVTIFGKTWLLHVKEVLRTTPDENLAMVGDTVRFLKDHGKFVIYDAEHACDGYKDDPEYAVATWQAAEKAGADIVVICDTNGGSLPREVAAITAAARAKLTARVGIHTHNDIGLGVANALAAIEAGATHVQGTINGYGERTGNCNLTSVIPTLALKMRKQCLPESSLPKLNYLSQFVDEIANIRHDPRQPWVGETAFAHKGGIHVNAVLKAARTYEHINPALVGNSRRVLISDLSGRGNIVMKARELGFRVTRDAERLKSILKEIKLQEHHGVEFENADASLALLIHNIKRKEHLLARYSRHELARPSYIARKARELGIRIRANTAELTAVAKKVKELEEFGFDFKAAEASLALLIRKLMKHDELPFTVEAYHVSMRRDAMESVVEATVKVRVKGEVAHTVAEGDGPVNALDAALRAALVKFFPELRRVHLTDYKVRIVDSTTGTAAKTRVLIESKAGREEWGTVGVSENIIEASLQALVDSFEYALMRK